MRACSASRKAEYPVSGVGLAGAIVGVVDVISRNISSLMDLQSRYKTADLKVSLLIGQLSRLKAALNQIVELMNTSLAATPHHHHLVHELKGSLGCCEVVILALEEKLCALRRSQDSGLDVLSKVQFVWDEKTMADYLSLLNNQINALNLFLTALQCRTLLEQNDLLQRDESRHLFKVIQDDTSSLIWLRDEESCGTYRSAVNENLESIDMMFDFDREIFSSKVYRLATRSNMIQNLSDGRTEQEKSVASLSDNAKSSSISAEIGEDKSDEITIRERPTADTCQLANKPQIPTAGGSQDAETGRPAKSHQIIQLARASYSNPSDRLCPPRRTQRKKSRFRELREEIYSQRVPMLFTKSPSLLTELQPGSPGRDVNETEIVEVLISRGFGEWCANILD